MKKIILIMLLAGPAMSAWAQAPATPAPAKKTGIEISVRSHQKRRIDSIAVHLLDSMSAMIGSLHTCQVNISVVYDVRSHNLGLVKHSDQEQLYLQGPDKLHIKAVGDKGNRQFCYNGKMLCYYSADRNQYSEAAAPSDIMAMIDSSHAKYGIDFPAADFFYPGFVDDIIGASTSLEYLGITRIGDQECFHIAGMTGDKSFQFWISDDSKFLPMKMVLVYLNKNMNPQYEASLSDWKINPVLDAALFAFKPPVGAKKIKFLAQSAKPSKKNN